MGSAATVAVKITSGGVILAKFESILQEGTHHMVEEFLKELLDKKNIQLFSDSSNPPVFWFAKGSAVIHIEVGTLRNAETRINVWSAVTSGTDLQPDLMRFLLQKNCDLKFGAFGINDKNGDIVFSHSIVGSTMNREELWQSVESVAEISDQFGDEIIRQWGGSTSVSKHSVVPQPFTPKSPEGTQLLKFLHDKGVVVKQPGGTEAYELLGPIASQLGKNYSELEGLLKKIKSALCNNYQITYLFTTTDGPITITMVTNFCTTLKNNLIFTSYYYDKKKRKITASLPRDLGEVTNFFTGGWLEIYVYKVVDTKRQRWRASHPGDDPEILRNIKLALPGKTQQDPLEFEMDLIARFGEKTIWIECKTGEYSDKIEKYKQYGEMLGIPPENRILVQTKTKNLDKNTQKTLLHLYGWNVVNLSDFDTCLDNILAVASSPDEKPEKGHSFA